MVEASW